MAVMPGFNHGVNYANSATSIPDFEGCGDESLYEGIVRVGNIGTKLVMRTGDSMVSVTVDDLWLVFPELTPASTDDSVSVREYRFADDVRDAADLVRKGDAYARLRDGYDASIGSPVQSGKVEEDV